MLLRPNSTKAVSAANEIIGAGKKCCMCWKIKRSLENTGMCVCVIAGVVANVAEVSAKVIEKRSKVRLRALDKQTGAAGKNILLKFQQSFNSGKRKQIFVELSLNKFICYLLHFIQLKIFRKKQFNSNELF